MNKVVKYLNQRIKGNVFDKPSILESYSTDRSILKITPKFVAIPECTEDIAELVRFADSMSQKNAQLPLTVRGSGLDKTGADLGSGMIISTEKLNLVQEIDEKARLVRVQAGVTLEKLNAVLAAHGLTLPVKSHPKETIGGLIANCPTDPSAHKYGSIFYYTERLEIVIASGEIIQTTAFTPRGLVRSQSQSNFEGAIYRELGRLLKERTDTVKDLGEEERDFAGYRMVTKVQSGEHKHQTFDLLPLFFASQGSLGIITEVILRCEPLTRAPRRIVAAFTEIRSALDFLYRAAELEPATLDLYDARIYSVAAEAGKELNILKPQLDQGYYVVVNYDDFKFSAKRKVKKCTTDVQNASSLIIEDRTNSSEFNELSAALTAYLNDVPEGERVSLVDDVRIPADKLPDFAVSLKSLEDTFSRPLPFYGSFATSSYSVRPDIELNSLEGRQAAVSFIKKYSTMVKEHGGSITGGEAEGRVKAIVTTPDLGEKERELYLKIKEIFDPSGILNPEVKLGADLKTTIRHLRTSYNGLVD